MQYSKSDLLTAVEAADLLPDMKPETVRRWGNAGRLKMIELPNGRKYFIRSEVESLLCVSHREGIKGATS